MLAAGLPPSSRGRGDGRRPPGSRRDHRGEDVPAVGSRSGWRHGAASRGLTQGARLLIIAADHPARGALGSRATTRGPWLTGGTCCGGSGSRSGPPGCARLPRHRRPGRGPHPARRPRGQARPRLDEPRRGRRHRFELDDRFTGYDARGHRRGRTWTAARCCCGSTRRTPARSRRSRHAARAVDELAERGPGRDGRAVLERSGRRPGAQRPQPRERDPRHRHRDRARADLRLHVAQAASGAGSGAGGGCHDRCRFSCSAARSPTNGEAALAQWACRPEPAHRARPGHRPRRCSTRPGMTSPLQSTASSACWAAVRQERSPDERHRAPGAACR